MKTVSDILAAKGHNIWSVSPDATVYQALQIMAEQNVGALLVLDRGEMVGILSERDYARKVILRGKSSLNTPVREIMTEKVFYVAPTQTLEECMALMTDKHIRHLPVVEDAQAEGLGRRLVGIVSIGDVVKAVIAEQQDAIQHLESYIKGTTNVV